MEREYLHKEITAGIIQCFYKVFNKLGHGFLEKVYENALKYELERNGFTVEKQKPVKVYYENQVVGEYFADLVVNHCIIVELKAAESIREEHELQLLNYLKATDVEVGLLLNFGQDPEVRRKVFTKKSA
jgi:GxxExxY protein